MSDKLACARAREAADQWLAAHDQEQPRRGASSLPWVGDLMRKAFAAGHLSAEARCGEIHGEEQYQWAEQRQIGQRRLDDATTLMREAAWLFRVYEGHHRNKMEAIAPDTPERRAAEAKVDRNCIAATRLEAWLAGDDPYPTNPAEAMRQIAEQMVDGETIKGVDNLSLDQAAEFLEEWVDDGGIERRRLYSERGDIHPLYDEKCGITDADRWRMNFRDQGRQAWRDGKGLEDCPAFPYVPQPGRLHPFAGVDHGAEWVAGWREENDAINGCDKFDNIMNFASGPKYVPCRHGKSDDCPDCEADAKARDAGNVRPIPSGPLSDPAVVTGLMENAGLIDPPTGAAPWRTDGVADLVAFRLTTGDPRFNPDEPVCVNGFLYYPATKEN